MEMSFGINGKAVGLLSSLQAVEQEEPGQTNYDGEFDETGYLSSDSSLYDVGSDDENYNDYDPDFNVLRLESRLLILLF